MALVLGIDLHGDFYVGDERYEISEIILPTDMIVTRARDGKSFRITDTEAKEIAPDVFMSSGKPMAGKRARCSLDAPSHIKIMRGDKYAEAHSHV
jgi:hypothetical protein